MYWPIGTKVKHNILPGTFIVQGPPAPNEIGYLLVPVLDESGAIHYFHPNGLREIGGVGDHGSINEHRHQPGNLPGLQTSLF